MSREVRFTVTDEEYDDILAYVQRKRQWRQVSHFLRYVCFQAMGRNPVGRHDLRRGADRTEPSGGVSREATDADA